MAHVARTSGAAFPFVLERLSNTPTRLQEPSPRTRPRPWESKQWGDAQSGCPRGLPTMRLWHGTLLVVVHVARTSGAAFPFVLERLSNTPTRLQEPSPRTPAITKGKAAPLVRATWATTRSVPCHSRIVGKPRGHPD